MPNRVMFYVQHLLGIGHVKRAAAIAAALKRQGLDVLMVLGGPTVTLVDFNSIKIHQLPPARAGDATFKTLLDENDAPITDDWRVKRALELLTLYKTYAPDFLIVELFPFGRRQFRFELLPLLQLAKSKSHIICSLRDVIVAKTNPDKNRWIINSARRYFDSIIVHGDEAILTLQDSFPLAHELQDLINYSGYVVERPAASNAAAPQTEESDADLQNTNGEIIVSIGGGAVGENLLRVAIETAAQDPLNGYQWRLLAGENLAPAVFDELAKRQPANVIVERARADFPALLQSATLSVSQGGYNTVMDVLNARCRNVIIPFAAGSESEQTQRAVAFEKRGLVSVLPESELSPQTLAKAALTALSGPRPPSQILDMNGAEKTASLLQEIATTAGGQNRGP